MGKELDSKDSIRKRVSYAKLKSYLDSHEEVTIEELRRLHNFLDTHMLYGSKRIADLYSESLNQLIEDIKAGISIDVTPTLDKVYKRTGIRGLSPQPYYALIHRGVIP